LKCQYEEQVKRIEQIIKLSILMVIMNKVIHKPKSILNLKHNFELVNEIEHMHIYANTIYEKTLQLILLTPMVVLFI